MKRLNVTLSKSPFQIRNFLIVFVKHVPSPGSFVSRKDAVFSAREELRVRAGVGGQQKHTGDRVTALAARGRHVLLTQDSVSSPAQGHVWVWGGGSH